MFTKPAARPIALTAGAALIAAPAALLVAAPSAHADIDRNGRCGGGAYEFSVDREGRGFEVSADLDNVRPGTTWQVTIKHDGKRVKRVVRTADYEGDVELDLYRPNTAGSDTFAMNIKRVGGKGGCSAKIVTS